MQIRLHAKNKGKFIHKPNLSKTDTIHKVFYDFILHHAGQVNLNSLPFCTFYIIQE